eukprot:918864-Pleurochrysis_carterae.AAC.1
MARNAGTQRVHVRVFCCVVQRPFMSEFCLLLRELTIVNQAMRAFRSFSPRRHLCDSLCIFCFTRQGRNGS